MKKVLTFLLVNCIVLSIVIGIGSFYCVNAKPTDNFNFDDYKKESKDAEDFSNAAKNITGTILAAIRYAGAGIAIICLIMIAMRYMVGSAGDKADYKKNLVIYAVGGIGMFSAATIVQLIQKLASEKVKV